MNVAGVQSPFLVLTRHNEYIIPLAPSLDQLKLNRQLRVDFAIITCSGLIVFTEASTGFFVTGGQSQPGYCS